jgi:hypothetical protein
MRRARTEMKGGARRTPSEFATALATRIRRTLSREMDGTSHLELAGPIVIRKEGPGDATALRRLAELDSRTLPEGSFLLAEVRGELVAAAPLDVDCELLKDPFRRTFNVRQLLELQAGYVRRAGQRAPAPAGAAQAEEATASATTSTPLHARSGASDLLGAPAVTASRGSREKLSAPGPILTPPAA